MTTYLLDANVLIALTIAEHEHHDRAARWVAAIDDIAVCPITEGALTRFLIRLGESPRMTLSALHAVRGRPGVQFWPDDLSYADADLTRLRGYRQVTDAYLAALAIAHGGLLATLDEGLAQTWPDASTLLP